MGFLDVVNKYRADNQSNAVEYFTPLEKEFRKRNTENAVKLLMERTEGKYSEEEMKQIMDLVYTPNNERDNSALEAFFPEFAELTGDAKENAIVAYAKNNIAYDLSMCQGLALYYETETASDAVNIIKQKPNDKVYTNLDAEQEPEFDARGKKLVDVIVFFNANATNIKNFIKANYSENAFKSLVFPVPNEKTIESVESIIKSFADLTIGSLVPALLYIEVYVEGMSVTDMVKEAEKYLAPYNEAKMNLEQLKRVYSLSTYEQIQNFIFD